MLGAISTISKPYRVFAGNPVFTICVDWAALLAGKPREDAVFGRVLARLSVRLISL